MSKFKDYNHFKNYCIKVYRSNNENFDYDMVNGHFQKFEYIYNELIILSNHDDIFIDTDGLLNRVSNIFSYKSPDVFFEIVEDMSIIIGKRFIPDILRLYEQLFKLRAYIIKDEVKCTKLVGDVIYKNLEGVDKVFNSKGLYFIYDKNNELAYIGKSLSCIIRRSDKSLRERGLLDFSFIEYRIPKTESDISIYEMYYINRLKPYKNKDIVLVDEPSVILPEISNSYVIDNKLKLYIFLLNKKGLN